MSDNKAEKFVDDLPERISREDLTQAIKESDLSEEDVVKVLIERRMLERDRLEPFYDLTSNEYIASLYR